jgi:hypothetical protein
VKPSGLVCRERSFLFCELEVSVSGRPKKSYVRKTSWRGRTPLARSTRRQLVEPISDRCCCYQQDSDERYCV